MGILVDWKIINVYVDGLVYQTVGASQYCGYEIELNLSLDPIQAAEIINTAVALCKDEQQQLSENDSVTLYSKNVTFRKMISVYDKDQTVWRMVIPDKKNRLPEDFGCQKEYRKQVIRNKEIG